MRLFSSSLSRSVFTWFISLPPNSVITWADLEKQFHKYFFSGVHEKKITDLVTLRQRNDESVESFMQLLQDVKNKCYSLVLDDEQLADLAFQGLLPHIKDKYAYQEFESLSHLVQRISDQDINAFEPRKAWNKKVSFVDEATSSDSDEEPVIGLAEWVKNKKPMSCPFVHKELEKFAFDTTKADRIFDFLLQEGQIKLSPNHVIPSVEELKKIKYCKWHNATSHSTNECKVFRQQLQSAIESGRIKFDSSKAQKPMKIDQHPFPTNMLDAKGKTKVLTSEAAERSASVDPQHQITVDDAIDKGLIQEGTSSRRPPGPILLSLIGDIGKPGSSMRIGIVANRKIVVGKKKDADKSGIGIKIIGIARSSSTVGSKTSNYRLLENALSAMVMICMIDQIGNIKVIISVLVARVKGEHQFTIGWGADSVCMTGLGSVSVIFPETKRNLRRWRMHEFLMNSYFAGMLILIRWNQGKTIVNR